MLKSIMIMYYDNDKSELIKSCKSKQISDFVKDTETGTVLVPTFRDIRAQLDSHAFDLQTHAIYVIVMVHRFICSSQVRAATNKLTT